MPLRRYLCTSQAEASCLLSQGVTISNDGATIMKLLDIVHPAAKTLVDISTSQDAEVRLHLTPDMSGCLLLDIMQQLPQLCRIINVLLWRIFLALRQAQCVKYLAQPSHTLIHWPCID